jgi:soluble lytic murein transglycosylase
MWRSRSSLAVAALLATAVAALWWWTRPTGWEDTAHPPRPVERAIEMYASGRSRDAEAEIRRFLRTYRAPAWEPRARLLAASHMISGGRAAEVPAVLPASLDVREPLFAHAELLRARGLLAAKRWDEASAAASRASAIEGFPAREEATRCLASALEGKGRIREAVTALERGSSAALRLEAARLVLRHGDRNGARRSLVALLLEGEPGDDAERALQTLETNFPDPSTRFLAAERPGLVRTARRWKDAGRLQAALDLLDSGRPLGATPALVPAEEALLEAEILLRLGRGASAGPYVARASRGAGATAEGARYVRAKLDLAAGRVAAHRAGLAALASGRGASPWRLQALADLARIAEGTPSETALRAYQRYRAAAGASAEPGLLWREAWSALDLGRGDLADDAIRRVLGRSDAPAGIRAAALYWSGRRNEAAGRQEAARAAYEKVVASSPNHHYGILAARRLRLSPPEVPDRAVPPAPGPASATARRWLEAARALRSVGLWEAAAAAYRAAVAAGGSRARAVALEAVESALAEEEDADAVAFMWLAVRDRDTADLRGLTLRHLRLIVPARDVELLARIARAAGLDPALVAAVVLQESAFNPLAVSSAGARGLLQLMPATAEEVAGRIGFPGFREDRLFDPEVNLRLGCAYLRDLLDRLGSLHAALAAYHAGASRAKRWAAPGDDPEGERYIERIPIPDTRGYVKRILANVRLYRIAYPEGLGPR